MNEPKKQSKLKPETVTKTLKEIKVKIKWLSERKHEIEVQIKGLEGTIRNYQDRCPHPKTQLDDESSYRYCTICGAPIGSDGKIIPPEKIDNDYDEELFK